MKAIVYREYGSPDVLRLEEVPKPEVGADEVLVRVHAASVNSWDWDLLRGTPFLNRLPGVLTPKYEILGADIAGRVEGVGREVDQFQPGDEVFGDISRCGWGGFAEYVCADQDVLAPKPTGLTFQQAAAVPQAALLALRGLGYKRKIQPEEKVLVNGAGGGAGTFTVQMAKSSGAEVTGVDSTKKLDMMRSIGADRVVDCTQEDFTRLGIRYDHIVDHAAHHSIFDCRRALTPGGTYVVAGGSLSRIAQAAFLGSVISMVGGRKMGILMHKPSREDLVTVTELLEAKKVIPVVDRSYALPDVPEALEYFGEGNVQGKIVITV